MLGVLLSVLLIGFGIPIGLSLGIALDQFKINDAIANLWGGVLGAGLGAAGGVLGGLVLYQRQRRDAVLPHAITLASRIDYLDRNLALVEAYPTHRSFQMLLKGINAAYLAQANPDDGAHISDKSHAWLNFLQDVLADIDAELNEVELTSNERLLRIIGTAREVIAQIKPELGTIIDSNR